MLFVVERNLSSTELESANAQNDPPDSSPNTR